MFTLWWYKGRDPDPGLSVAPMYEPPAGMTPAEAGALLGDEVHPRDITSTLVDLAVRGFVKIEEVDDKGLVFHHKDYIFHLLKPRDQWSGLAPHEQVMLENVFANGEDTRLSSLKNRFYTAIPVIRQDIKSALKIKGMYLLDPDSANGYSVLGIVVIVAPFLMMQFLWHKRCFQLYRLADWLRNYFRDYLVAVCAADDGEDGARWTHVYSDSRVSGVHEPRGCRPDQAHASRHIRKISAVRHGAGRRASLGAGVRRDRERSSKLVRLADREHGL